MSRLAARSLLNTRYWNVLNIVKISQVGNIFWLACSLINSLYWEVLNVEKIFTSSKNFLILYVAFVWLWTVVKTCSHCNYNLCRWGNTAICWSLPIMVRYCVVAGYVLWYSWMVCMVDACIGNGVTILYVCDISQSTVFVYHLQRPSVCSF